MAADPLRFATFVPRDNRPNAGQYLYSHPESFCVWSEKPEYLVFPSYGDYVSWSAGISARHFHEVICEDSPQRLKFDIDADVGALAKYPAPAGRPVNLPDSLIDILSSKSAKFADICMCIVETIADLFMLEYGREPDFIVCESPDMRSPVRQYSRHIIIDGYYVSGAAQAREFTARLIRVLPASVSRFLDRGVNKRLQHFRLPGCSKSADPLRIKRVLTQHTDEDAIITNVAGLVLLDDIALPGNAPVRTVTSACPADVNDIFVAAGLDKHHRFRMRNANLYVYNRISPSFCEFCKRTHERDNTLILQTVAGQEEGIVDVHMSCRKWSADNAHASRRIGSYIGNIEGVTAPAGGGGYISAKISAVSQTVQSSLFRGHRGMVYSEPRLRPFPLCETLVVHAAMKMGKTKTLRAFIDTHFPSDSVVPPVIRFVSFRQTFGANIKESFPDFTLYSDVRGTLLCHARLIIQVESLHRLEIGDEPPDLLILDECESIFEQFSSGLLRNFAQASAKFIYMLKHARHVVCMDANITSRTENILRSLRSDKPAYYYHNQYKNATDYTYRITNSLSLWATGLDIAITNGKRIAIPSSSLNIANAIADIIRRRHPNIKAIVYSSETEQSVKSAHFSNVNETWTAYDVVIYTPTLTAGVSFEAHHFDYVYGYFTDRSTCDLSCIQMIGRIRDVASREIILCIVATGADLPTDHDEIVQLYYDRRSVLFGDSPDSAHNGINAEYDSHGQLVLVKAPYFHIWVENVRAHNLSRNDFIARLLQMIANTGATITQLTLGSEMRDAVLEMHGEIVEASQHDLAQKHTAIAEAPDRTDEEIATLRERMDSGDCIAAAEVNAIRKYALRQHYEYDGNITPDWVRSYASKRARSIYRNLCYVGDGDNTTLARIRATEAATYSANMQLNDDYGYVDIHKRYAYVRHTIARDLLTMCGFSRGIYDDRCIHRSTIVPDPHAANCLLGRAAREFEWAAPGRVVGREAIESAVISMTAAVLRDMYGFGISSCGAMLNILRPDRFIYPGAKRSGKTDAPRIRPVFSQATIDICDAD